MAMEASLENSMEMVLLETSEEGAATTGDFIAIAIDESFKADGQASQPRVVGTLEMEKYRRINVSLY